MKEPPFLLSKIPDIWFVSRPINNKPSDIAKQTIKIFDEMASIFKAHVVVNILTGIEGKDAFQKEFPSCNIYTHEYNISKIKYPNVLGNIRNTVLDLALEKNQNSSTGEPGDGWLFMFDDDVEFLYKSSADSKEYQPIDNPADLFYEFINTWASYITTPVPDNCLDIGMIGMPCKHNTETSKSFISYNNTRLCQAVLINYKLLKEHNIRYEENVLTWEDFDLLINLAYHRIGIVGINNQIHFKERRQMFDTSATSSLNYNTLNITTRSANLYRRWGYHIIPKFRQASPTIKALNVKVGNQYDWILRGCPIEFNNDVMGDLDELVSTNTDNEFDKFKNKYLSTLFY